MHATTSNDTNQNEIAILARILGNDQGELPPDIARYILALEFGERDKARMHELAVRNQEDALSNAERDELIAYAKAGSLLGILKSRVRRVLGVTPKKRTAS